MTQFETPPFSRGEFGEIFPPPLTIGLSPEEAIDHLVKASEQTPSPITRVPSRGHSRDGLTNLGLLYVHQVNLARAIAGELNEDSDAAALHRLVVTEGEPLSLRPLGCERLWWATFAPVLQRVSSRRPTWRVGLPSRGRCQTFEAALTNVIPTAQQFYVDWSMAEEARWDTWLKKRLPQVQPAYQQLVWEADLTTSDTLSAELSQDYFLERLGKHSTYRLTTPQGERILEAASPNRALRLATVLLHQQQAPLPSYPLEQVRTALQRLGAKRVWYDTPNKTWHMGETVQARTLRSGYIGLVVGAVRYGLQLRAESLTLGRLKGGRLKEVLATLVIDPTWPAEGQTELALAWAGWVLGGGR